MLKSIMIIFMDKYTALFAMAGGSVFVGVYGVCALGYVEQWGWCTTICKNKTTDTTSVEPVQ